MIVGNGMAASRLLDDLIRRGATSLYRIKVFGEESGGSYNRVQLGKVLGGAESHAILMKPSSWYAEQGVEFVSETLVSRLDTSAHRVLTADGGSHRYDLAVLATGSTAFVPPIEGIAGEDGRRPRGVFVYRTLEDCPQGRHLGQRDMTVHTHRDARKCRVGRAVASPTIRFC